MLMLVFGRRRDFVSKESLKRRSRGRRRHSSTTTMMMMLSQRNERISDEPYVCHQGVRVRRLFVIDFYDGDFRLTLMFLGCGCRRTKDWHGSRSTGNPANLRVQGAVERFCRLMGRSHDEWERKKGVTNDDDNNNNNE